MKSFDLLLLVEKAPEQWLLIVLWLSPSVIVLVFSSIRNLGMRGEIRAKFERFDEVAMLFWALSVHLRLSAETDQCCYDEICVVYWFLELLPLLWGLVFLFAAIFSVRVYCRDPNPFTVGFGVCVALATTFLDMFYLGYLWALG